MALIVVGGHSRSVGKTSVVAELISALREYEWVAAKISQHRHQVCCGEGACDCVTADHTVAISEERDRAGKTDTSRYLAAGATRALWVRMEPGFLAEAMPRLRQEMAKARNVILESNSVLRFVRPDLYIVVLDPATEDFKESARKYLERADAVVARGGQRVPLEMLEGKPVFGVDQPGYVSEGLVEFVRERIESAASR